MTSKNNMTFFVVETLLILVFFFVLVNSEQLLILIFGYLTQRHLCFKLEDAFFMIVFFLLHILNVNLVLYESLRCGDSLFLQSDINAMHNTQY